MIADKKLIPHCSEQAVPFAPTITLGNGVRAVPQHFLKYNHCIDSVEKLLVDVEFSEQFPLFVNQDSAGLYLQVGIIGRENYQKNTAKADSSPKIVYGRKWRIEPNLPTSEILQTAFLAIKSAYEHELRELFKLRINDGENWATPFNSHLDLPLMSTCGDLLRSAGRGAQAIDLDELTCFLQSLLKNVMFDGQFFKLTQIHMASSGRCLIDLQIQALAIDSIHHESIIDVSNLTLTILEQLPKQLDNHFASQILYRLMDQLIVHANHYVEENFKFRQFARFSRQNCVKKMAEFSYNTRNIDTLNIHPDFTREISAHNCEVDESRVPRLSNGPLSKRNRKILASFEELEGFTPMNLNSM